MTNTESRKELFYKILFFVPLATAILARIYQYIFTKNLWLDEAMLAYSLYGVSIKDWLLSSLPFGQSAPLGFLSSSKIAFELGVGDKSLYFLPFISSILILYLAYKISFILFASKDCEKSTPYNFGVVFFITLVCGSLSLLHYSTEFKQYGIEALCAFWLFYLYIKNTDIKLFCLASILCFLFSNTSIFISCACLCAYVFKDFKLLKNPKAILFASLLFGSFVAYYFLYIKFQAVQGFYEYWDKYFLPLNPLEYPVFIKDTLLHIYIGFTPFGVAKSGAVLIPYMLISCFGLYALFKSKRDLFVLCATALAICLILNLARIYPFGSQGVLGGRLSLFMSVIFYTLCTFGAIFIFEKFQNLNSKKLSTILKNASISGLVCLIISTTAIFALVLAKELYKLEETRDFVAQIPQNSDEVVITHRHDLLQDAIRYTTPKKFTKDYEPNVSVLMYVRSQPAFLFYSYLYSKNIKYTIFNDIDEIKKMVTEILDSETGEQAKIYVLASHYEPEQGWHWDIELAEELCKIGKCEVQKGNGRWGSSLIKLEKIRNKNETRF